MDSKRFKQVDGLLQSALERPSEERDAFLRHACVGDEALEREVRSLLASQQNAGSFLESSAMEVAARSLAHQQQETQVGQTISHYRIVENLGSGGMGVVYKAEDTRLHRFVALKFLPDELARDPEALSRFRREARAASVLNHPNIATIHDIVSSGGIDFIVMEYVAGVTLDRRIPRHGMRLNELVDIAVQIADALAKAHAAGIVHRDLKPGNIMVNEEGRVKLLDFGLAKLTETGDTTSTVQPVTESGSFVGTIAYMSPEQAEGKRVDARTDIFSFGAVLYQMITGRSAFVGDSMASILSAILRDEPKPAAVAPGLPRELDRIVSRCLQKDPDRRYQHAGDLKIDLQQVKEELAGVSSIREQMPRRLSVGRWWWLAAAIACAVVSVAVGWRLHGPQATLLHWKLTRLTSDAGLSDSSALSSDGKLVAYSSARGVDGTRDLFVKQVAGGQPIRLTSDGAGNTTPDFSPDGTKIVFRSNRNGGGIYKIPAFGGEVRLLARDGLNPKYSPDGTQVAYWVGTGGLRINAAVPGAGAVWVVPVAGGQPQRVGPNFTSARFPIWSPDGKRLLFIGYKSAKAFESSSLDWWLVATTGGEAVKTDAYDALVHAGLRARDSVVDSGPRPACWSAATNTVMFSIASGDTQSLWGPQNLWEMGITPRTGKVSGVLRSLTAGAGNDVDPSCISSGALTFTNAQTRSDVWSLPIDLDRGSSMGVLERVTQDPAWREHASLSTDGRYVSFASNQSGQLNIWMLDLATGKESSVAGSSFVQRYPVTSASGARSAFSVFEKNKRVVYVAAPGGAPEKLCEGCLRATDWSRDDNAVLVFGGNPYQVNVLDVASHQQIPLLTHPNYHLLYGRFSPDNRWVSFTARIQPNRGRIVIAPIDGPKPVPEGAWITIADAEPDDWANWSADGKTLYFTSGRDGHNCLWGQRIEARSHRPVGEAFAVQHLHGRVS